MASSIPVPNNRDFQLPMVVQGPARGEIPNTHLQRNERLRGVRSEAAPRLFRSEYTNTLDPMFQDQAQRSYETNTKTPHQTDSTLLNQKVQDRVTIGNDLRPTRLPYQPVEHRMVSGDTNERTNNHLTHLVDTDTFFRTRRDSENMLSRNHPPVYLPEDPEQTVVDFARIEGDLRPNHLLRRTEVVPPMCKSSVEPTPLIHDTEIASQQSSRIARENMLRKPEHSQGMDIREEGVPFHRQPASYHPSDFDDNLNKRVETDSQFRKLSNRDSRLPYTSGITCKPVSPLSELSADDSLVHAQSERARVEESFRPQKMMNGAPSGIPARHVGGYAHLVSEKVNGENVLRPIHVPFQKQYNIPTEKFEVRTFTNFGDDAPEINEDETIIAKVDNESQLRWKYTDKPTRQIVENIPLRMDSFPNGSVPLANYSGYEHPRYQTKTRYATMEEEYPSRDILSIGPIDPSKAEKMQFQQKPGRLLSETTVDRKESFPTAQIPLANVSQSSFPSYTGPATRAELNEKPWGRPDVFPTSNIPLAQYRGENRGEVASRPASQAVRETALHRTDPFPNGQVPLSNVAGWQKPSISRPQESM